MARIGARLSSIRARMVLLILTASVPLLIMAVVVTWQNYDTSFRQSREKVRLMRATDVARHQAAVTGARQLLGALAATPVVASLVAVPETDQTAPACIALMQNVRTLHPQRYLAIGVADQAGPTPCQAAGAEAGGATWLAHAVRAPWYRAMLADGKPGSGPITVAQVGGTGILPLAVPILADGRVAGAVLTLARIDWLSDRDQEPGALAWLIDGRGQVVSIQADDGQAAAGPGALPPQDQYDALARRDSVISSRSRSGGAYVYASTELADGLRLLVGTRVSLGEAEARRTLLDRMVVIGLLTLLALSAVLVGAHYAVVAPVKRLAQAVREWRGGGVFDPGLSRALPDELRDLALSFAEASGALQEREQQLRGALAQQELLMQEIHHRVKNNLQIIASLLNLQSSRIRLPQARAEFQSARDRVRALATLHRYLYSDGEVHTINMRSFLTELCGQLFEAMGETEGLRIRLDIEAPELRMLSDQAVPLSLIVTEVVGNALKYAFPDGRSGRITIRLTADETMAELLMADDGVGPPAPPPAGAEDPPATPPGIGMQLIRGFVRQLRATLEIDESHGTSYLLRVPLQRERSVAEPEPASA